MNKCAFQFRFLDSFIGVGRLGKTERKTGKGFGINVAKEKSFRSKYSQLYLSFIYDSFLSRLSQWFSHNSNTLYHYEFI